MHGADGDPIIISVAGTPPKERGRAVAVHRADGTTVCDKHEQIETEFVCAAGSVHQSTWLPSFRTLHNADEHNGH